jgi:putative FmdB family regulatory protein
MPRYDYQCEGGHVFERDVPLSQFDFAQKCECGAKADQVFLVAPGFNASEMQTDRENYMKHNITFTGGTKEIQHKPNEHALQCACDGCRGHRRRAGVTSTAEPMRRNRRVAKEVRA